MWTRLTSKENLPAKGQQRMEKGQLLFSFLAVSEMRNMSEGQIFLYRSDGEARSFEPVYLSVHKWEDPASSDHAIGAGGVFVQNLFFHLAQPSKLAHSGRFPEQIYLLIIDFKPGFFRHYP